MKLFESEWMIAIANQVVTGINSTLAMAPSAQKHLMNLEDCTLKIQLKDMDTHFFFGVEAIDKECLDETKSSQTLNYKVKLLAQTDAPSVTITGSPLSFIKLATQKNKATLFHTKELVLEGDSVRIQQILAFLSNLQIDWEGLIANYIGDIPAHLIGTTIRSGLLWGLNFSQSLIRDTEEYIKYELRLLPDRKRAQNQFTAIAELTEETDKLNLRFEELKKGMQK